VRWSGGILLPLSDTGAGAVATSRGLFSRPLPRETAPAPLDGMNAPCRSLERSYVPGFRG
jgi:hypothetical protein